ncbi:MAG TPA: UTP--glucose-1-phosphate uridylyltransferase [Solirubrobacteraceae bacterium]|jgi:UTP--glucose-1-phosphate uridylyltransferase|nr:UTP--glucose-1-phosphate uridylyltransferase [Solirubrobacteraceae bacterium]
MADEPADAAAKKMRENGQSEAAIRQFTSAIERVRSGAQTLIPSSELEPVPDVPELEQLAQVDPASVLERLAVVKLNGGLATSMGLREPKSLLEARDGRSFLQIIVGQTLALRRRYGVRLPLILMNSEATREPSLTSLARYPELRLPELPEDFLQSMVPKLDAETMLPARWPAAPQLEWCPPGHGDVYAALVGSGTLEALRDQGFRYLMISNSDNLGAVVDPRIAGHVVREQIPFLMEVVLGTAADRKGGHIARRLSDGRLILRETAQTPPEDEESFRDYKRWRYYNTNSLWIDMAALEARFVDDGGLELPVIVNRKTVDPRDPNSPPVLQLESAMGAAIGSFPGAQLLQVPRTRFVPVKTTDDLLVLRSDAYRLGDEFRVEPATADGHLPLVALDKEYFAMIDDFDARMADGPPSLRGAERLVVNGDVSFGAGVIVRGDVEINASPEGLRIDDGSVLSGS